ncbi:hypothetical protein ELD05_04460 [Caldicellulosiruptor changbaiensis]|uniref:BIG2 domain-containing protein n=1 Tax=Caldicellulosiruptor changbaiensis TaxID=1222016 RepID=A0A3T0D4K2_9FIRM|nr:hypothetical protein [Caldicellulosiruptor changbaiensis]AZT89963.1 hypothetical protein ELD05_04460 [Caldicellulosiruptor changbaiensis]
MSTEVVNIDNTGESVFVDAIIKCKDGTLKNVSDVAKWESKNNDIAITYQGRILAINKGQTIGRVSFANYTKEIIVNVNK